MSLKARSATRSFPRKTEKRNCLAWAMRQSARMGQRQIYKIALPTYLPRGVVWWNKKTAKRYWGRLRTLTVVYWFIAVLPPQRLPVSPIKGNVCRPIFYLCLYQKATPVQSPPNNQFDHVRHLTHFKNLLTNIPVFVLRSWTAQHKFLKLLN